MSRCDLCTHRIWPWQMRKFVAARSFHAGPFRDCLTAFLLEVDRVEVIVQALRTLSPEARERTIPLVEVRYPGIRAVLEAMPP